MQAALSADRRRWRTQASDSICFESDSKDAVRTGGRSAD